MKLIPLTQGKFASVDDADYDFLTQWKWQAVYDLKGDTWYARRGQWNGRFMDRLRMHRVLLDAPAGVQVDHKDGNGLNNTRANIRLATQPQNQWNTSRRKDNTSGSKGVSFDRRRQRWRARIQAEGKPIYLGSFPDIAAASQAYCEAAIKYHGDFAFQGHQ